MSSHSHCPAPKVIRVVASATNGCFKINYSDNVVLAVDPNSRTVAFSVPSSRPLGSSSPPLLPSAPSQIDTRPRLQMLDYLTSDIARRLVPIVDQIVNPLRPFPLLFRPLIEAKRKEKGGVFTTGYEIVSSLWSASAEDACASGLVEFRQDGSVCVDSEESSSHLHLSNDGLRYVHLPLYIHIYPLCTSSTSSLN